MGNFLPPKFIPPWALIIGTHVSYTGLNAESSIIAMGPERDLDIPTTILSLAGAGAGVGVGVGAGADGAGAAQAPRINATSVKTTKPKIIFFFKTVPPTNICETLKCRLTYNLNYF